MSITFSSCFYVLKAKFSFEKYIEWMNNFLSIVNNFNLVIYTDENSCKHINVNNNPKIKVIIKPFEEFYCYKNKPKWILNHHKNTNLNNVTCWELNMLWCEKINFVKQTIERKYFDTDYYGWCDIGYFRNRNEHLIDTNIGELMDWPDKNIINSFDINKIYYGCINNNDNYLNSLNRLINDKTSIGLPKLQIPSNQLSVAGGFFILHKNKINWWFNLFYDTLEKYINNNYLIKDDQIIIADCIFSNLDNFYLFRENNLPYDNWFMFQRILKKNNTNKISILMPIYNGIEFIGESIESVLQQTYLNWELIIGINGHLPDSNVYKIAKNYEKISPKIKVYDFYNYKGKANTLNAMINYCNFDFVAILDVDDIWLPNKLEIQNKYLDNYDVVGSNCVYFGDINGVIPKIPQNDISNFDFSNVNPIINSSSIIKKTLCYWNENGIEDYDLWLRLRKQNKKFYNCSEVLVKHRIHKQSAFNSKGHNDKIPNLLINYSFKRFQPF